MIVAVAGLAACGGGSGCRQRAMADTTGWRVQDEGAFVFKLPPGYKDDIPRCIDSYIGDWNAGDRTIGFDWGRYTADPRVPHGFPLPPRICKAHIGGRKAVVAQEEGVTHDGRRRYSVHAWWRGPTRGADDREPHLSFGGSGPAADSAGRAETMTIIRTVRFRTRWTPRDSLRFRHRICERMRADMARTAAPSPPDVESLRDCPAGPPPPPADYESVR